MLGRALLFSALTCSLSLTSAAVSSAGEPIFIGNETTGCDYNSSKGNAPKTDTAYGEIYGGKIASDGSAKAAGNKLSLGSKHQLKADGKVYGGFASGKTASEASTNNVVFDQVTTSGPVYVWGGYAKTEGNSNADAFQNSVQIKNVFITDNSYETNTICGGAAEVTGNGNAASYQNNVKLESVNFTADSWYCETIGGSAAVTGNGNASVSNSSIELEK